MISAKKFTKFLDEIEAKTKWTFSGDVDLVLTNARFIQKMTARRLISHQQLLASSKE